MQHPVDEQPLTILTAGCYLPSEVYWTGERYDALKDVVDM